MKNVHERINILHSKTRTKHKLGMHDQREHGNWSKGPGMYGGEVFSALPTSGVLFSKNTNPRKDRVQRQRSERLASIPVVQQQVDKSIQLRSAAITQQQDYNRRHRMRKRTALQQGDVFPDAMHALPYGAFFEVDTDTIEESDANLFQDPRKITGMSPYDSQSTNLYDFVNSIYDQHASTVEENLLTSGRFTDSEAQSFADEYFQIASRYFEATMRKAAASFAADVQGFFGGQIYGNADRQYIDAISMANLAKNTMELIPLQLEALYARASNRLPSNATEFEKLFQPNTLQFPIDGFIAMQVQNTNPDVRKLMPINSALVSDIIERSRNSSSTTGNSPSSKTPSLSNDGRVMMPLTYLYAFLHPDIQSQIDRIAKAKNVQYPSVENPSEKIQMLPLDTYAGNANVSVTPAIRDGVEIFSSIVDELHTDGGLHEVSIVGVNATRETSASYLSSNISIQRNNLPETGKPFIMMNSSIHSTSDSTTMKQIRTALTLAHEFGHLIDFTAMPFGEAYWSDSKSMTAIISKAGGPSDDYPSKAEMAPPIMQILNNWHDKNLNSQKGMLATSYTYLSQPQEIFARLYEQFVAEKIINKLRSGEDIPTLSLNDSMRIMQADLLEDLYFSESSTSMGYFPQTIYTDSLEQMKKIFSIMGWKIK